MVYQASILLCILLGGGLRLWWALSWETLPSHDMKAYLEFAASIANGDGYSAFGKPTAYWPVGYSAVLAGIQKVWGTELIYARLAQALFGTVSLACLARVVRLWSSSTVAAVGATLLIAIDPTQIAYTSILISEPLFNCLMLLGAAMAAGKQPTPARLLIAGAVFGFSAMTRAHGLLLPLLCGVFLVPYGWRRWKPTGRRVLLLYAGLCVAMAPWWVRNALAFEAFVPVSNNGGINLFIGNNPAATGGYKWGPAIKDPITKRHRGGHRGGRPEYERGRVAADLAWEYIESHPRQVLALVPVKLELLFSPDSTAIQWNRLQAHDQRERMQYLQKTWRPLLDTYHLALGAGAVLGIAIGLGRGRLAIVAAHGLLAALAYYLGFEVTALGLLLLMIMRLIIPRLWRPPVGLPLAFTLTFAAIHVVYFASGRFLFPVRPFMAAAAGTLLAWGCAVAATLLLRFKRSPTAATEPSPATDNTPTS